jgi:hypothetical protein
VTAADVLTRERATGRLAMAGYGREAVALLDACERWPGLWQYTADRHRCAVKHMPAGTWEVRDCAESEDRIAALRTVRRRSWIPRSAVMIAEDVDVRSLAPVTDYLFARVVLGLRTTGQIAEWAGSSKRAVERAAEWVRDHPQSAAEIVMTWRGGAA